MSLFGPRLEGTLSDYEEGAHRRIAPATGFVQPFGPAQHPAVAPPQNVLQDIKKELAAQNIAMRPHIRCQNITSAGQTLDWSGVGTMSRLLLQNTGTNTVYIAFDTPGPSVEAQVSDLSFPIVANGAIAIPACLFQKIGCKCAGTGTAVVSAIAFQNSDPNYAGALS